MKTKKLKLTKPIKNIGVDFDDVLHDFNSSLHKYHNKKYGTNVRKEDVISYDIEKIWGCTKDEAIEKVHEFYRTNEHDQTLPLKNSPKIINNLSRNYFLHIITSRVDEIKDLTLQWLEKHFPNKFSTVNFVNHYGQSQGKKRQKADVCKELSVDLMIEDSYEHALAISKIGIPVLLINCPWNQGETPEKVYRVKSWSEIGDILLD